ncbi:MAG: GNAT family N-acetyltransferase [Brumimicrobium sp.]|nr:GNAT family N-acetyltransferase [Brumimicrobium sp.]
MFLGKKIYLRQLEKEDAPTLLSWENDCENWRYSETEALYSLAQIQQYIEIASDIRQTLQLRLMICLNAHAPIGNIDLFQIDFKNKRAGVGILIDKDHREKRYASEALLLLESYVKEHLDFIQLFCTIRSDNKASIQLFESSGYEKIGVKKKWYYCSGKTYDAYFYQKIL